MRIHSSNNSLKRTSLLFVTELLHTSEKTTAVFPWGQLGKVETCGKILHDRCILKDKHQIFWLVGVDTPSGSAVFNTIDAYICQWNKSELLTVLRSDNQPKIFKLSNHH